MVGRTFFLSFFFFFFFFFLMNWGENFHVNFIYAFFKEGGFQVRIRVMYALVRVKGIRGFSPNFFVLISRMQEAI